MTSEEERFEYYLACYTLRPNQSPELHRDLSPAKGTRSTEAGKVVCCICTEQVYRN